MEERIEVPDSANLVQHPEALKKLLMAQVRAGGGSQALDTKALVQNLVKQTFEALLEVEMEEHLGSAKYAPEGRGSGASRNGATAKTVRGDFGEVALETPRDRNGEFEPKIVGKRQTSVGNFTEIVISLYARGMSTREIEEHVKQLYGIDISPQFVSRATEQLHQQITDWQSRPLERIYPVVFVDGLRVAIRSDKGILKKCVYTVLGVGVGGPAGSVGAMDGGNRRRSLLAQGVQRSEGARGAGHPGPVRRWPDRIARCGPQRLPANRRATVRRSPDPERHEIRFLQGSKAILRSHAADLYGAERCGRGTGVRSLPTGLGRPLSDVGSELAQELGRPDGVLQLSGRVPQTDLYHQRHREPTFTDAQEHRHAESVSQRRRRDQDPVPEYSQFQQSLVASAGLGYRNESARCPLR